MSAPSTFAVVIPADPAQPARIEPWPAGDAGHLLAQLYRWMSCGTVDCARLPRAPWPERNADDHLTMWIDDEGLYAQPVVWNDRATVLAHAAGHMTDGCAGTIVVSAGADEDGNSIGLPRELAEQLLAAMPLLALLDANGAWT